MNEETATSTTVGQWSPADVSPVGWIALGFVVAVVGGLLATADSTPAHLAGIGLAWLGSLLALLGVVVGGVELGIRRSRQ